MISIDENKLNELIDKRIAIHLKELTAELNRNKKPQNEKKSWLNSEEAAEYLGFKLSTLYKYSCTKHTDPIPFEKTGKWKRFNIEDLDRWQSDRTIAVKSDDELDSMAQDWY